MALGAGVLISSVAFELMDEAYNMGGLRLVVPGIVARGLLLGWHGGEQEGGAPRKNPGDKQGDSATAIAIGALLDGIPESAAIGITYDEGGQLVGLVTVDSARAFADRYTFRAIFSIRNPYVNSF